MSRVSSPLVTVFVIIIACLAWISGISYGLVYFFGISSATGWTVAGFLTLLATLVGGVFLFEMRHAVDLTDCDGSPEFEIRPLPAHRREALAMEISRAQSLQVAGEPV